MAGAGSPCADAMLDVRRRFGIPALAVVTLDQSGITSSAIQGVRQQDTDNAATLEDYFHIGSCAKSALAVAAGKLVEDGKLSWRSRLLDVLPELASSALPDYADVTLEDLLLCRAGIAPYTTAEEHFPELNPMSDALRLDFTRYLLSLHPAAPRDAEGTGFEHLYSNASYTAASCMLERVAGMSWHQLMRRTLGDDLGFDVQFGWPNAIDETQEPWGHGPGDDGRLRPYAPDDPYGLSILLAPAGDINMTPLDYARYVRLHLEGLRGGDNYLRAGTYRHIHNARPGFALGVANGRYLGKRVSQFDGSAGTFYCHTIIAPGAGFAFAVMANAGGPSVVQGIYELSGVIMQSQARPWWRFWR